MWRRRLHLEERRFGLNQETERQTSKPETNRNRLETAEFRSWLPNLLGLITTFLPLFRPSPGFSTAWSLLLRINLYGCVCSTLTHRCHIHVSPRLLLRLFIASHPLSVVLKCEPCPAFVLLQPWGEAVSMNQGSSASTAAVIRYISVACLPPVLSSLLSLQGLADKMY